MLPHLVQAPNVTLTALDDNAVIGESFSMECNVIVAKDINGGVDIVWTVNGSVKRRLNDSVGDMNSEYVLHRDVYNIPTLQLSDNNAVYYCEAIINTNTLLSGNDSITISLIFGKLLFPFPSLCLSIFCTME